MTENVHWLCAHNQQYCVHGDDTEALGVTHPIEKSGQNADERREDIVAMDILLLALARLEHRETGNTVISDQATRLLIKMADDLVETE